MLQPQRNKTDKYFIWKSTRMYFILLWKRWESTALSKLYMRYLLNRYDWKRAPRLSPTINPAPLQIWVSTNTAGTTKAQQHQTVPIYQQIHCRKSVSSIWYRQKSLLIRICFNPSINFLPIGGTPAKAKIPLFSIFQSRHQELHSSKDCYHWEQLLWVVQWLLACFPRHSLGQNMTIWLKQSKSISQLTLSLPHHSNTHTCIFLCSPRYYPLQPLLLRLLQPRAATWPSFLLQCYMILPSMLRTLFKCIHFIPRTLEYFHSYMIFF